MLNINFVPDDYVQNSESRRTNLIYLVLFLLVMSVLCGSFVSIKLRQRAFAAREEEVNRRIAEAKGSLQQFEELQAKRKEMIKAALLAAELLEPVQRSVLLASLTNNLPAGVSLLQLELIQKEPRTKHLVPPVGSKYQQAQDKNSAGDQEVSQEKMLETHINIEGIAPSDLQVAAYIEQLDKSLLLDNVALVESRERKVEDEALFRQFKLTAMLKKKVHLTKADIAKMKSKRETGPNVF
jgi:Tfp pilus assembly protein PilN